MASKAASKRIADIPLARVQLLSDFIFASAMTIMVLNFDMPSDFDISSEDDLLKYFAEQREALLTYAISFLLVFIYWMKHLEHFSYITKTSSGHVWLQAFFLMSLMIVPVTNTVYSTFPDHPRAGTAYCVTVIMVGLFSYLSWRYATKEHRLVDPDMDQALINDLRHETLVEPIAASIAILAIWFVTPALIEPIFLALPVLYAVRKKLRSRRARASEVSTT